MNLNLKTAAEELCESFPDIHPIETPHLSLSKTFILRYHWIDSFFSSLREQLHLPSSQFDLQLSSDVVYFSNEEKTRHFACILASEWCNSALACLVEKVDSCLIEFNLPVYYNKPSFHVSFLWKLTEFSDDEKSKISLTIRNIHNEVLRMKVDKVSCKSGNKIIEVS
jgi:U6 snRNA phosphodiesterase